MDPCVVARAPAPGPLAAELARADTWVAQALVRIREARLTQDPGFYTLAEQALRCELASDAESVPARRWLGHVRLQFHDFTGAEALLAPLAAETAHWRDLMLWSDSLMEQGRIDEAEPVLRSALHDHPSLETWDRAAHLAWLRGELAEALTLQQRAVDAGVPADPEPLAWALVRLGELKVLAGERPNELGLALQVLPDYAPGHLALGRWLLGQGDPERAAVHLLRAGPMVAAVRALAEIDAAADVHAVGAQDPRGYGVWLAPSDPSRALALLEPELGARRDAATRMAMAWALHHQGADGEEGRAHARAALQTGIVDPSLWVQGAVVLTDPALAAAALEHRASLLPSEIVCAESVISSVESAQL